MSDGSEPHIIAFKDACAPVSGVTVRSLHCVSLAAKFARGGLTKRRRLQGL